MCCHGHTHTVIWAGTPGEIPDSFRCDCGAMTWGEIKEWSKNEAPEPQGVAIYGQPEYPYQSNKIGNG